MLTPYITDEVGENAGVGRVACSTSLLKIAFSPSLQIGFFDVGMKYVAGPLADSFSGARFLSLLFSRLLVCSSKNLNTPYTRKTGNPNK